MLAVMIWFIAYGSLFPFDFAASPLPLSHFLAEVDLFANRADAVDNFLLFLPFGVALHASFEGAGARALAAVLGLLALGLGIQLLQLYLPSRTASLTDVAWNGIGMAGGMLLAARIRGWLAVQVARAGGVNDKFLLLLLLAWLCYESFPFVPTLDLGMLRAHVKPAVFAPAFESSRLLQHAAAASLAGMFFMHVGWLRRPLYGLVFLGTFVLMLEVAVPYGALRRETLLGIVLGLASGVILAGRGVRSRAAVTLALSLAMLMFTVVTPYRGQMHGAEFSFLPFSTFFRFNSLGSIPPLAFETLALGSLLWSGSRLWYGLNLPWYVFVFLLLGLFELLRISVFRYHGDTSLLLLSLLLAVSAEQLQRGGKYRHRCTSEPAGAMNPCQEVS